MLARMRPASKMLHCTVGPTDQNRLPPREPVAGADAFKSGDAGEIKFREQIRFGHADVRGRGGQLAFGQRHVGPAQEQFRRQAHGHFRRRGGNGRDGGQFGLQRFGRLSQQNAEPVNGSLRAPFPAWAHSARVVASSVLACCTSRLLARPLVKRFCVIASDCSCARMFSRAISSSPLITARFDVIARDFAEQRDQDVALAELRGGDLRLGRLHGAAFAAEHVNLPRGVETGLIEIVFKRDARRQMVAEPSTGGWFWLSRWRA